MQVVGEATNGEEALVLLTSLEYDVVLLVAGGPSRSPYDPEFDARTLPRFIVYGDELPKLLDRMDRDGSRYVSDGDPNTVARPGNE